MHGDLREKPLQQLLQRLENKTGYLVILNSQGHSYKLGLHKGTLQTLYVNDLLLSHRRQVVEVMIVLLKLTQGEFTFTSADISDLQANATPMNLARLIESASAGSATIKENSLARVPDASTPFIKADVSYIYRLSAEMFGYWQEVAPLLPSEGQGLNAEQLAERLGCTTSNMRLRLYRFEDAGLITPA